MRLAILLALVVLFALPAAAAPAPSGLPTSLPFSVVNDLLVLKIGLQGEPVLAVLDSGAQGTVIDSAYAAGRGIALNGGRAPNPGAGRGPGGGRGRGGPPPRTINDQPAAVAANLRFQLGGQVFALSPGVTDLGPSVVRQIGAPVVLGRDVFNAYVVELDFETQSLTLHARPDFTPPKGASLVALTRKGGPRGAPQAPLQVEDGPVLAALVDTGDPRALGLNQTTAKAQGLDARPSDTFRGYGVNVITEDKVVTVAKIQFGGVTLTQAPAAITADSTPIFGDDPARIGLPLLSRFHVWIDLAGDRLWLAQTARTHDLFRKDTLGFSGQVDQGQLRIDRVAPGGPAAAAGLKAGDTIVQVNRQDPLAFLSQRPWNLLVPLTFKLGDGRSVQLRPAEFY